MPIGSVRRPVCRQAMLDLAVRQAEIELEFATGWESPSMKRRDCMTSALVAAVALSGCASRKAPPEGAEAELPTLDVTHWTEKTELFMEYPPLVAGRTALFAVHLTRMDDFKPVTAGRAKVEFMPEAGGRAEDARRAASRRDRERSASEDAPPAPGRYRWALVLDAPDLSDRHDLGTITVFADEEAARADAEKQAARRMPRRSPI